MRPVPLWTVDLCGFRNKDIVILEKEFNEACDNLYMMTDDGTYGEKGFGHRQTEGTAGERRSV